MDLKETVEKSGKCSELFQCDREGTFTFSPAWKARVGSAWRFSEKVAKLDTLSSRAE